MAERRDTQRAPRLPAVKTGVPRCLAPMGGGPSAPELALVIEAGGLGFLAGAYLGADRLRAEIRGQAERTRRPFGINVFVPGPTAVDEEAVHTYLRCFDGDARRLGIALGEPR